MRSTKTWGTRYDDSIPEIKTLFPTPAAYADFIEPWADAVRVQFPSAKLLLCGSWPGDASWTAGVLNSTVGRDERNDLTMHIYTALPDGPYDTQLARRLALDQAVNAAHSTRDSLVDAPVQLPPSRGVWFTEIGVCVAAFFLRLACAPLSVGSVWGSSHVGCWGRERAGGRAGGWAGGPVGLRDDDCRIIQSTRATTMLTTGSRSRST